MYRQIICLFIAFILLSSAMVQAAITGVADAAVINDNFPAVTGAPDNTGFGQFKNGKKGEWRRRKFPKPVEAKKDAKNNFDDHADEDGMDMDKRSFYGDYGYYYYWCG